MLGSADAQQPERNAQLNCTSVYFEGSFADGVSAYILRLYNDSLKKNEVLRVTKRHPAFFVHDLEWGKSYWWQISTRPGHSDAGDLRKFTVMPKISWNNITDTKLKVITNETRNHSHGLLMLDYARGIFTRGGRQIWTVPDLPELRNKQVRDLKLSPDNTITFLGEKVPAEIDFEGRVLWKAPVPLIIGKDTVTYHHDFRKLAGNRYFVLGQKDVLRRVLDPEAAEKAGNRHLTVRNDTLYRKCTVGLLLEFDFSGKLLWYWDSNTYHTDQDLNFRKGPDGLPNMSSHMNAFSVDIESGKAYVGYRDLNRIVKIDMASKKVEYSFGESHVEGEYVAARGLFRGQHDATLTDRQTLLVFNNNTARGGGGKSEILELMETAESSQQPLWRFGLDFDTLSSGKSVSAGNLLELNGGNLLVCAGTLPRLFEVNRRKQIVWDAFVFSRTNTDTLWTPFPQYRMGHTPQLYFYHFLSRVLGSKNGDDILEIINTGNAADYYTIEIIDKGTVTRKFQTKPVEADKKYRWNAGPLAGKEIRISSGKQNHVKKIIRWNQ